MRRLCRLDEGRDSVRDELDGDRREEETGDACDEERPALPEDPVDDVREPHRSPEAHADEHEREHDGQPVARRPVGTLDEEHRGNDRTGAGQERRPSGTIATLTPFVPGCGSSIFPVSSSMAMSSSSSPPEAWRAGKEMCI